MWENVRCDRIFVYYIRINTFVLAIQFFLLLFVLFQCQFEDVLAEPEGTHSIDCVWKLSYTCFNLWKNVCYKLATLCCGICIAAEWGCEFAYVSFYHIWFITPFFKWLDINCGVIKRLWGTCVSCCCEPCCTTFGLVFHQFKK